jgi:UDP-glucose 4-epimerase
VNWLITGGCGFIGVNLVLALLDSNRIEKIRIIDNLSVGKKEHLYSALGLNCCQDKDAFAKLNPKVELMVCNIHDENLAMQNCEGMDIVVHLAANTGVISSLMDPIADFKSNVVGTINYLEASRMHGVKKFLFASSGAVVGEQKPPINEDMVPHPISPYGASKLCGESYCSAYHGAYGLNTTVLRFGNVYGPHSYHKGSVIAKFIKHICKNEPIPIFGDGTQTRDFIYINDLIAAIFYAIERNKNGGEIFQIATHQEHSVFEVAQELNRLSEKYLKRRGQIIYKRKREGEVQRNFADITKAKRVIGFEPQIKLKKGLENTLRWFLDKHSDTKEM